ncbi:MAG: UvrD-helicase domain-containing protein [Deltaproteobacteria bacterium]|nr:UvrD-helicase domain-containing protein [Deltaproteobacteria bacterium]
MKSTLLKASAGSGKTTRLTEEVFKRILVGGKFIAALTFTRAATTEMRSRIMKELAEKSGLNLLECLRLIMEAGRVGYSTIDSFFYRLFAAAGSAPKLADEKAQMELLREIEILFRDRIIQSGKADKIIVAAKILRTDIDTLWGPLADEQTIERCQLDRERLADLDDMIKENAVLRNTLKSLSERAEALADQVTSRTRNWVIDALVDYDNFIAKAVATYSDLEDYKSLGRNIPWHETPYSELNRIFKDYRKIAERLAVNKALLRELAVASLCGLYLEAANTVKKERGLIFFPDVRRELLALDGAASIERPKLMSNYFSLGLDRTEHLLIDEFQDTSKGDIEILLPLIDEILSGRGERGERSFFAVGDWKQMIYGWRGADREALEAAVGDYIANQVITESSLEYNYRSTPLLISFFNELVVNLFEGKEKTETQQPPPEKLRAFDGITEVNRVELEKQGNSQDAFYTVMVEYLKKKKAEYGCLWGDMAVLALTNNHVQKIEAELLKNNIKVAAVKGRQLLSTQEGTAVMLFIAGVLTREDKTKFIAQVSYSPLWKEMFGDVAAIRTEFAQKYPQPFGLMAVSAAIELLRGKLPSTILDIWQDEAQTFFSEGGADADSFLLRMFNVRFSVKVPEAEQSENIKVDTIHGTKGLQFRHVFVFWHEDEKTSPFYLEAEKCHVQFGGREIEFLKASDSALAGDIIENHEAALQRLRREKANVFYVAATRAVQTLTVFLPKNKKDEYKGVHQAVLNTFSRFAPEGVKKEICLFSGKGKESQTVITLDMPVRQNDEPEKYGEIDPALVSANIKAGIMRGDRLHRWLTQVVDGAALPPAGELNAEEYKTAIRFIERKDVSAVLFRPGNIYIEQLISDKESFGIVDRMIVADDLVTIIDYKSGSMKGLRYKYEEQLKRYTKIMKTLYPQRNVEYYILSIDV